MRDFLQLSHRLGIGKSAELLACTVDIFALYLYLWTGENRGLFSKWNGNRGTDWLFEPFLCWVLYHGFIAGCWDGGWDCKIGQDGEQSYILYTRSSQSKREVAQSLFEFLCIQLKTMH
jgi:hypothetical protein